MSMEIEIKLALGETGAERLQRHPLLASSAADMRHLGNTYFDTPTGELEAARIALRLRRDGDSWRQTLKTSGEGSGGYSQRHEWEWPVTDGTLDLIGLAEVPPMVALGTDLLARLEPRFTTDFERRRWQLELAEASVEVALDQGEIRAADRRVPIHELELELKEGDPQALWHLALTFAATLPLRPADASKAARGSALLSGHWTLPQGDSPRMLLHRALLALDAFGDSGEEQWLSAAENALHALAESGEAAASQLIGMLPQCGEQNTEFGRVALRLAQHLAAEK